MRSRVFNICQYEMNPVTKEDLHFSEENIFAGLRHKSIKDWAYICHDKDKYNDEDETKCIEKLGKQYDILTNDGGNLTQTKDEYIKSHKWVTSGYVKPRHWHIVLRSDRAIETDVVAKWFGIESQYIQIPKGRGSFLDCLDYLTHSNERSRAEDKYLYDDREVKSNIDFRAILDKRKRNREEFGRDITLKTELRLRIMRGELTLRDLKRRYPEEYANDKDKLKQLRLEYIQDETPPMVRHNFYISGDAGVGKGASSAMLAHLLFPDIENEDDLLFRVTDGSSFEGYDGQPVIIWDDCRSYELFKKLGSRGNIFNVFDTVPHKQRQNVKYGSINLINKVNIVNSVQSYTDFLNGLVGNYRDKDGHEHGKENEKAQSYRRFPFIMPLRAEDFDILINRAYMEGKGDGFEEYIKFEKIKGSFAELARKLPPESKTLVNVSKRMVQPLLDACDKVEQRLERREEIDESEFADWGYISDIK